MTNPNTLGQEQSQQTRSIPSVNFSHRLSDPDLDNSLALSDNIGSMADRANGVLSVLFWYFNSPNAGAPSDGSLCMAIDSVIKEIEDIKAVVSAYCEADIAKREVQS